MDFFDVFGEMLVILAAIAAGFAANRLGYLGGETDQRISKLLLNITMPAMIVAAVITGEELPEIGTILSILEVSVVFYLLAFAFVLLVPRFLPGTPGQKGVWRYALAFPNVGFIGYPVAVACSGTGRCFTPPSWPCPSTCSPSAWGRCCWRAPPGSGGSSSSPPASWHRCWDWCWP